MLWMLFLVLIVLWLAGAIIPSSPMRTVPYYNPVAIVVLILLLFFIVGWGPGGHGHLYLHRC